MDEEFTYYQIKVMFHVHPELLCHPYYHQGILASAFSTGAFFFLCEYKRADYRTVT